MQLEVTGRLSGDPTLPALLAACVLQQGWRGSVQGGDAAHQPTATVAGISNYPTCSLTDIQRVQVQKHCCSALQHSAAQSSTELHVAKQTRGDFVRRCRRGVRRAITISNRCDSCQSARPVQRASLTVTSSRPACATCASACCSRRRCAPATSARGLGSLLIPCHIRTKIRLSLPEPVVQGGQNVIIPGIIPRSNKPNPLVHARCGEFCREMRGRTAGRTPADDDLKGNTVQARPQPPRSRSPSTTAMHVIGDRAALGWAAVPHQPRAPCVCESD